MNNTPCERCKGEGCIEITVPGNEGVPEYEKLIECPDCGGSGLQEDADKEYGYNNPEE